MDLITTHINSDFDGLGSLVAARKLYPGARLLLPGSQEEAVRKFLALAKDLVAVEREKECRIDDVDRLILVDTRHKSRIGIAARLIDNGVEVHIYDHHPKMKGDIVADKDVYEEVGATVTMLLDIIRKKGMTLTPVEATIMLLGIYEETGSLTYRITTRLDVDMVSFLLSQGANLQAVSSYLNREMSEGELSLLVRLINSSRRITVKGITISTVELDRDGYAGELGIVIHKLMDIENIPVLFVFINTMRGRIDIIARSGTPVVDVNKLLSHFGGGGHPGAAAAKVRGEDIGAVKERLMSLLKSNIRPKVCARDIMSRDVKVLSVNDTIARAKKTFLKEKTGGVPVVDGSRVVGIITPDGVNKAIKQGFEHSRIKGYMSKTIITAREDTPLYAIHKMASDKDAGVLPVIKARRLIGVINRTDILKGIHAELFLKPRMVRKDVVVNLCKKMKSLLPREIVSLMNRICRFANSRGAGAFVVGGLVRDLILGAKNLDLDIVIEGDAIKIGRFLARELKAAIVVHRKFGTCSVITKDRLKIDLATARKEVYEEPGALPTVEFSSLKDDLIRRDFTINAMAVSLNQESFGRLIDFFGGERDLSKGRIRVMHDGSFIDDPTRIFRAVRFEQRFGFVIDRHTEDLIKNAIDKEMFDRVAPQRIRDEIVLILKEEEPLKALRRMAELDELRFLHPGIRLDSDLIALYGSIAKTLAWYDASGFRRRSIDRWLVYLMALFGRLSYNEVSKVCDRFVFRRGERLRILSYKRRANAAMDALAAKAGCPPSRVYRIFEPLSFEVSLLIMAGTGSKLVRARIRDFFERYNGARISIKGEDLKAMGLEPCPEFKTILKKILYAKIDGALKTKKDELEYAKKLIAGRLRT